MKIIILKNTTAFDIYVLGRLIPALDQDDFSTEKATDLRTDDNLLTLITNGDIVVNNGVGDIEYEVGIAYVSETLLISDDNTTETLYASAINFRKNLTVSNSTAALYKIDAGISLEKDDIAVTGSPHDTVNYTGNVIVTDAGAGQANVNIGGSNGLLGGLHQLTFLEHSSVKNKWLGLYDGEIPSNYTFGEMPWKSKLVGITYSNKYQNSDTDINIYSTPEGGGSTPKTLDYTWSILDKRVARKTNFTPDIIFDAGDKIAVYFKEAGNKDPKDPVVILYFQIIDTTTGESGENFSGSYSTGTGGGSS